MEQRVRLIAAAGADAVIVQVCTHGLALRASPSHGFSIVRALPYTHAVRWPTCCIMCCAATYLSSLLC